MQGNNMNNVRYETTKTFRKKEKEYPKTELMNLKLNTTKIIIEEWSKNFDKYEKNTSPEATMYDVPCIPGAKTIYL